MSTARKAASYRIFVPAMDCPDEEKEIRAALGRVDGVEELSFRLFSRQVEVRHRGEIGEILSALRSIGMEGHPIDESLRKGDIPEPSRAHLAAFFLSLALLSAGALSSFLLPGSGLPKGFFLAAVLAGGARIAVRGAREIRNRSLGMNALMTISIAGAAAMGEFAEAGVVVALFALANHLEAKSLDRARRAAADLYASSPETAVVRVGGVGGKEVIVPAEDVRPGDLLIVRPGEKIPVDAVVFRGVSDLNEAMLTGEPVPVEKSEGSSLYAGTVNGRGLLLATAVLPLSESAYARILRKVEEAHARKAPIQAFMDRFARIYTPFVLAAAALTAFLPPLLGHGAFADWAYRALVLLIIACPCAIVLAAPVATVSALTRAMRDGILVKGANHLEALGKVRAVAFDKTGTLTRGKLTITRVLPAETGAADEVVRLAAAVEAGSAHPAAEAIRHEARRRGVALPARGTLARTFEAIEGRGVSAEVEGTKVFVGNRPLFEELGAADPLRLLASSPPGEPPGATRTVSIVGTAGEIKGILEMRDEIREEAASAVSALRSLGVEHVAMLTGDRREAAHAAAREVGIDEVLCELLPEEKLRRIEGLVASHGTAAMVGDGVNDAPALALSTVGIAMGAAGSPAAIETADVALMTEDLRRIPGAIALGRRMVSVVRQNVAAALAIKAGFLAMAVGGLATLWMAVAADMGTTLLVIGNGLRLLRRPGTPESPVRAA